MDTPVVLGHDTSTSLADMWLEGHVSTLKVAFVSSVAALWRGKRSQPRFEFDTGALAARVAASVAEASGGLEQVIAAGEETVPAEAMECTVPAAAILWGIIFEVYARAKDPAKGHATRAINAALFISTIAVPVVWHIADGAFSSGPGAILCGLCAYPCMFFSFWYSTRLVFSGVYDAYRCAGWLAAHRDCPILDVPRRRIQCADLLASMFDSYNTFDDNSPASWRARPPILSPSSVAVAPDVLKAPAIRDLRIPVLSARNVIVFCAMREALRELGSGVMHVLRTIGGIAMVFTGLGFVALLLGATAVQESALTSPVFVAEVFAVSVIMSTLLFVQLMLLAQTNAQTCLLEEKVHRAGTLACDVASSFGSTPEIQSSMAQVRRSS